MMITAHTESGIYFSIYVAVGTKWATAELHWVVSSGKNSSRFFLLAFKIKPELERVVEAFEMQSTLVEFV